jgi:hypothetical protein
MCGCFYREHFVCGGVSALGEGALFARRIISELRKVRRRLIVGGEHADATTNTGHIHDAG